MVPGLARLLAGGQKYSSKAVDVRPIKAAVPYTNSPGAPSSTFVRRIRFSPRTRIAMVQLGGKGYMYPMTPTTMAHWLSSRSLGRYYNKHIKLK